jgi:8-oxo-dGTP diphosphatase
MGVQLASGPLQSMIIQYVVGVIFDLSYENVLLIKKNRPDYLKSLWNGIGGKVEKNESYYDAMVRETQEECGLTITNFREFADMSYDEHFIKCFCGTGNIREAQQLTDEAIAVFPHYDLPIVVSNIHWLIPMARDVAVKSAFVNLVRL